MKKILLLLSLISTFLYSCKNGAEYKDLIYITGIENSSRIKFTIDGPQSMGLTATASGKASQDIQVQFEVRPDLLKEYNNSMNKKYEMPPAGSYEIEGTSVTMKAGSNVSDQVKISILSVDQFKDGAAYCIPITIKSVSSEFSILESSRTAFITIDKTTITRAADFRGNYLRVDKFATDPAVQNIPALTMECRFKVDNFSWINTVMGIEENFLMRCVDWDNDKNYNLEMDALIVGGKKYRHEAHSNLTPGKWYHAAIVCTGSKTCLYINGELDSEFGGREGSVNLGIVNPFYFGSSCGARYLNGSISEARIWSRALTAGEIQDNLCYVDPTSEGLLAYWRFNEVQDNGNVLDLTGHGYDAVKFRNEGPLQFTENVRCPF